MRACRECNACLKGADATLKLESGKHLFICQRSELRLSWVRVRMCAARYSFSPLPNSLLLLGGTKNKYIINYKFLSVWKKTEVGTFVYNF